MVISEEDLDYNYNEIIKTRRTFQIIAGTLTAAGLAGFVSLVFILGAIQKQSYATEFWGSIPTLIISAILIAIFKPKQKKYRIPFHRSFFIKFYEALKTLQDLKKSFEKERTEKYEKDSEKANDGISTLADFVDGWSYRDVPQAFKSLPLSISENLRKRIIPIIQTKDKERFVKFYEILKDECELLYKNEPTYEEWSIFNENLKTTGILLEEKPIKKKTLPKLIYILKPYVGAPLLWAIFTGILFYQPREDYIIPLAVITGVSFGAATFLTTEYVRTFVSKHQ